MPISMRPRQSYRAALLVVALAAVCSGTPALAQFLTPGAVQDTLPPKPSPKAPPAQMVFPKPPPTVKHDPKGRRFSVNAFHFVGNTVYSDQTLKRLTERYIDLQLNLYDLSRAADAVRPATTGRTATRSRARYCRRRRCKGHRPHRSD